VLLGGVAVWRAAPFTTRLPVWSSFFIPFGAAVWFGELVTLSWLRVYHSLMTIEICAANLLSALNAAEAGADRIELCDNLWEGGTTPSAGMLRLLRRELKIEIFVLIRPRGGDFCYSPLEFEAMLEDIQIAKEIGADGIVSGALNANGTVDCDRTSLLVEAAYPLPFTFHRAFDCCKNLDEALEDLIFCGAKRVLTSGGCNSVPEGLDMIKRLQNQALGRIIILAGGGINANNIGFIKKESGCTEFHLSAKKPIKSDMQYWKDGLFMNGSREIKEDEILVSDKEAINNLKLLNR